MQSFSELSLSAPLKSNLVKHGFTEPTPIQALAIVPALAGRDVVATAQTGTGKTLAFVLPIIHLIANPPRHSGVRAVILSPTRELPIQLHGEIIKLAVDRDRSADTSIRRHTRDIHAPGALSV